jgi:hypothetical protein
MAKKSLATKSNFLNYLTIPAHPAHNVAKD